MNCTICDRPIEPGRSTYQEVTGYVRERKGGGANQIRRKEPTGRYACADCVENKTVETIPGQMSLVGDGAYGDRRDDVSQGWLGP